MSGRMRATRGFPAAETLTPDNVDQLEVAWTWRPEEQPRAEFGTVPGNFTSTPIMIDDTVYVSSNYNRVAALDAETGAVDWVFDPRAYADGMPALGGGFRHRGVTMWRDGEDLRIFLASRHRLFCLDAQTGDVVASFGDDGVVDLSQDLIWPIDRGHFEFNAAPVIYKNLVIVGSAVGDRVIYRRAPPGDVRAYDARHRRARLELSSDPAGGRVREPDVGERSVALHRCDQRLGRDDRRQGTRAGVSPGRQPTNVYYGGQRLGDNLLRRVWWCSTRTPPSGNGTSSSSITGSGITTWRRSRC